MKHAVLACAALLLVAASPANETHHTVKDGETLNGIANRAGVSASAVVKANKLKEPYAVRVGQVLVIPRDATAAAKPTQKPAHTASASGSSYVVKDGETLNGIANRAGVSASALAKANNLKEPYAVRVGQKLTLPHGAKQAPASPAKPATASADKPAPANAGKPAADKPASSNAPIRSGETYTVKPGETFNGIATRAGIPRSVLAQANGLTSPYVVKEGQTLRIPRQRTHVVANGETGRGIATKYGVPYDAILTANGLSKGAAIKPGQKLVIPAIVASNRPAPATSTAPAPSAPAPADDGIFHWPLAGKVIKRFDANSTHRGIDIEATPGETVVATRTGKVIYAGEEPTRYGKLVVLEHAGQWYSAYAHLSSIAVSKGETVKSGEMVGQAGSTGEATTPQLHFELRQANRPIDPLTKLP